MKLLLDTHSFLWFIQGDQRLSSTARTEIESPANVVYLSIASAWEIAIKSGLGRLSVTGPLEPFVRAQLAQNGFHLLAIGLQHIAATVSLPPHHRDPFDRLLIAQAVVEGMSIVGGDNAFSAYQVPRIW